MYGKVLDVNPEAQLARVAPNGIGSLEDNYLFTAFSDTELKIGNVYSFIPQHGFADDIENTPYQLVYIKDR